MSDPEDHPKEETVVAPPKEAEGTPAEKEAEVSQPEGSEDPRALKQEELGVRPGYVPGSGDQPSAA